MGTGSSQQQMSGGGGGKKSGHVTSVSRSFSNSSSLNGEELDEDVLGGGGADAEEEEDEDEDNGMIQDRVVRATAQVNQP